MSVLYTTTAENEAWLVSKDNDINIDGFRLSRMWPYIDATAADTLSATMEGVLTYSGPLADQQTYAGTFVNSKVQCLEAGGASDDNNQRYVNILQDLIKVTTVTGVGNLSSTPIVVQENEILDLFAFEQGELDTMAYQWNNIDPSAASRKACFVITDGDLEDLANVATNSPATLWEYQDRRFDEKPDGTATFTVLWKQAAWTNITGATPNQTIAREVEVALGNRDPQNDVDGIRSTRTATSTGIPTDDIEEVKDNQIASSGHAITSISIRDNKDGSSTLNKTETKIRAIDDGEDPAGTNSDLYTFETEYKPAFGNQQQSLVNRWFDLSQTDAGKLETDAITNQANMANATYAKTTGVGYSLASFRKLPVSGVKADGDQLFDVVRSLFIPRNGSQGFWGDDSGYGWTSYIRKKDSSASSQIRVAIETLRTNNILNAYNFSYGAEVSGHSLNVLADNVTSAFDISIRGNWTNSLTDAQIAVVGFDAGNQSGVWRKGQDMYKAVRVCFVLSDLPV